MSAGLPGRARQNERAAGIKRAQPLKRLIALPDRSEQRVVVKSITQETAHLSVNRYRVLTASLGVALGAVSGTDAVGAVLGGEISLRPFAGSRTV